MVRILVLLLLLDQKQIYAAKRITDLRSLVIAGLSVRYSEESDSRNMFLYLSNLHSQPQRGAQREAALC
jgi:hypothetical protein